MDPKPYTVGGPELRRCRACGFSLGLPMLTNVPGKSSSAVILHKGVLTRVKSHRLAEFKRGLVDTKQPKEQVGALEGCTPDHARKPAPSTLGHSLTDAGAGRATLVVQL